MSNDVAAGAQNTTRRTASDFNLPSRYMPKYKIRAISPIFGLFTTIASNKRENLRRKKTNILVIYLRACRKCRKCR